MFQFFPERGPWLNGEEIYQSLTFVGEMGELLDDESYAVCRIRSFFLSYYLFKTLPNNVSL